MLALEGLPLELHIHDVEACGENIGVLRRKIFVILVVYSIEAVDHVKKLLQVASQTLSWTRSARAFFFAGACVTVKRCET